MSNPSMKERQAMNEPSRGITLSGTQVDMISAAVAMTLKAAQSQSPSGKRTMAIKHQRAIFAAARIVATELEDASSSRRRLEYLINHPDDAIDIQLIWGEGQ